eukprot:PLAT12439.1.p1 GENE.PLAT12439.1~~PLAT12439.1.p1  ORF type:complete len:485 (+),score=250.53 PLAT12439.1:44-1456(+)
MAPPVSLGYRLRVISFVLFAWGFVYVLHTCDNVRPWLLGIYCGIHFVYLSYLLVRFWRNYLAHDWKAPRPEPKNTPFISVIVPAHNEVDVVARLVDDLLALDYPQDRYEVIIVDDRSTDGTRDVLKKCAEKHGTKQLKLALRDSGGGGKAGAMNFGWDFISKGCDIVGYIDADAFPAKTLLKTVARTFDDSTVGAAQCLRVPDPSYTQPLALLQHYEFWIDVLMQQMRAVSGGVVELRGNGEWLRYDVLELLGDWNEDSLTDDLDMTMRIYMKTKTRIAYMYYDDALKDEPIMNMSDLFTQRHRWVDGGFQRFMDYWQGCFTADRPLSWKFDMLFWFQMEYMQPIFMAADIVFSYLLWDFTHYTNPIWYMGWFFIPIYGLSGFIRRHEVPKLRDALGLLLQTFYLTFFLMSVVVGVHYHALFPKTMRYIKADHGAAAQKRVMSAVPILFGLFLLQIISQMGWARALMGFS